MSTYRKGGSILWDKPVESGEKVFPAIIRRSVSSGTIGRTRMLMLPFIVSHSVPFTGVWLQKNNTTTTTISAGIYEADDITYLPTNRLADLGQITTSADASTEVNIAANWTSTGVFYLGVKMSGSLDPNFFGSAFAYHPMVIPWASQDIHPSNDVLAVTGLSATDPTLPTHATNANWEGTRCPIAYLLAA